MSNLKNNINKVSKNQTWQTMWALDYLFFCLIVTIVSFCLVGRTYSKFVSKISSDNNIQAAGFFVSAGGFQTGESELTTIIAPGQMSNNTFKILYFSQVPTEFLNVNTQYISGTGVLADFDALLNEYESYKAIHNPNGKAPASLDECFIISITETSFSKLIAKELYTNHGLEKLADHAVGPMSADAASPLVLSIPLSITWVEHNDPDWDTWDTFLGSKFAMSSVSSTITIKIQVIAQQIIGDITMPSVPVIVDGTQVGSFHLQDGQTIEEALSQAQLGISTDNSIGWYLDENYTQLAPDNYVPKEGEQIYTRMATLDKLTFSGTTVSAVNRNISGEVVIPKTVNGQPVTEIASAAFIGCSNVTDVIIPTGVTTIGSQAFYNCSSLTSITLPQTLKTIEPSVFSGCSSLIEVTVPSTVTNIGASAFKNNTSLTSITIPSNIETIAFNAFEGCSSIVYNQYDNAYYLGNENNPYIVLMKAINTSITSCEIAPNVKIIYYESFNNCSNLTTISSFPNSIIEVMNFAFSGCSSLEGDINNFIVPSNKNIGVGVFNGCSSLSGELVIPDSVTTIGSSAFKGCSGLSGELVIPDSVTTIGYETFYNCSGLTGELVISKNVSRIESNAFMNCSGITNVIIPNGVTTIGSSAFRGCSGLTEVVIPTSVTTIGSGAFSNATNMQTLIIDSETVANNDSMLRNISLLTGSQYKNMVIYINNNISGTLGVTLTNNYNKQASSDKVGYSMWVRK